MTIQAAPSPVLRAAGRGAIPLLASAGFVLFWSSGFIGARWGTGFSSAFDLLAWRFLVAGGLAAAVLLFRPPRITRRDLVTHAGMAFLTQFVYLGLIFAGIDHGITAGVSALIGSLQPLMIATVAGPLLGEHVSPRQWAGLTLGLGGVALVVADDLSAGHGSPLLFLLPLGGLFGLVAGTCLERRRKPTAGLLDALCLQCVVSGVLFVATAAATRQMTVPDEMGFYGAALWLVVLSTGGGWGLYLVNLRLSGATRISSLLYLVPPTTMVIAFLMFGETIGALAVVGMSVCAIAVVLIRLRDRSGAPCAEARRGPEMATLRTWRNHDG